MHADRNTWLRDRKNWATSNAITLVWYCLSHPAWIMCVKYRPASIVDLCLILLSWLGSRKPLDVMWNWRCVLMTFLISLPVVLSRTMGRNDLGVLYKALLGLGITTVVAFLN